MVQNIKTTNSGPRQSTVDLIANFDAFYSEFVGELNKQKTKANAASERRMRKLLREFHQNIYVPYRDASLGRNE